jgi:hypothetical protein
VERAQAAFAFTGNKRSPAHVDVDAGAAFFIGKQAAAACCLLLAA